ncbi:hypothetical protein F66182_5455 [Fusarium sp. NRRL 66182]|nr:hypothetical protein F66182_5455 [Fusarium sp. NRRL 66182]
MGEPCTPDSRKSSSSPEFNAVTPPPHPDMTPFTDLGTSINTRFHKTSTTRHQSFNDSPSIRSNRVTGAQDLITATPEPSSPAAAAVPWSPLYSSEAIVTAVPSTDNPSAQVFSSVRDSPRQPQHPLAFSLMAAQTSTPANPIRQPAVPPSDHASSVRNSFPGHLAPSPAIWEGLKGHFGQLDLGERYPPSPALPQTSHPSIQPAQSCQLPPWLANRINQQPRFSTPIASPVHLSSPTLRQPPAPRGFRPMAAIAHARAFPSRIASEDVPPDAAAFSGNYKGEHSVRNASVAELLPEQNCALWLTNLPPDVTHRQLLAQIRNVGRIWCTVINEPDYERHDTAAAKVVFFAPEPAQRLLSKSLTQGLHVGGYPVKVTHNRVKYGEQPAVGSASRVLIITGKSAFVNAESLTEFFKARFVFEIDEITPLIVQGRADQGGRSVVEYRFGSFRCQAQMGKMALEKDRPFGFEKVEFGPDPCEVDTLSSYGIAAERIQGKGM